MKSKDQEILPNLSTLVLMSTDRCLLNCEYCYVKKGSGKMPVEIAKKAVEWAMPLCTGDRFKVDFFGGDPLLNMEIIEPTILHALELNKTIGIEKLRFAMFLNGYNDNTEKFLDIANKYEKYIDVQFSIDGCRKAHDSSRRGMNGESTWDKVLETYHLANKKFKRLYIHPVISPSNIEFLSESTDFLVDIGIEYLDFALSRETGWDDKYLRILVRELDILANKAINWVKSGSRISVGTLLSPILAIKHLKKTSCYCGKDGILVNYDGLLYPCQRFGKMGEKYSMGNVYDGLLKDHVEFWSKTNCYNTKGCSECNLFEMCIGPCLGANIESCGDVFTIVPGVCKMWKVVYTAAMKVYNAVGETEIYQKQLSSLELSKGSEKDAKK